MPVQQAIMIALSGFIVVFLMLSILWFLIAAVNKVISGAEKKTESKQTIDTLRSKKSEDAKPEETIEIPKAHEIYGGEIALYDVDEKTAACIMAIVSDSTKIPLDHLVFKSIKALN